MEPLAVGPEVASGGAQPSPHASALLRHIRVASLLLATFLAVSFVGFQARTLWAEWSKLERERQGDERSRIVGYKGVAPHISYAKPPRDWFHDEGDRSVLWAGWDRAAGTHRWFTLRRGELDPSRLSHPMGRDTVRTIDHPRFEVGGGEVWDSIRATDMVAAFAMLGRDLAYPFAVLDKVLIVNDEIPDLPLLVVFAPFEAGESAVSAFDPTLRDERLKMGHSGYLFDGHPLLFDRGTESLWVADGRGLTAVSGQHRGARLKRIARATASAWGPWREAHPSGRLLVGDSRPAANPGR